MNKRLLEIRARKMEIRKALEGDGKVELNALQEELKKLDAEQKEIEEREKLHRVSSLERSRKACRKEASHRPP